MKLTSQMKQQSTTIRIQKPIAVAAVPLAILPWKHLKFLVFICIALGFAGCSHKSIKPNQVNDAIRTLEDQTGKIKSCRGRAWISIDTAEGKASFSGVIVVDRTTTTRPQLRIEALDPFGTLHHLILIQHHGPQSLRLLWIDFDNKVIQEATDFWKGVPLALFPNLLLGAAPPSSLGWGPVGSEKTVAVEEDHFRVTFEKVETDVVVQRSMDYFVTWIPPGSRLALRRLQTVLPDSPKPVEVEYSHFPDKKDFYSPEEMNLQSKRLSVKLSWRERTWNDTIESSLFEAPQERFKGFSRERQ